MSKALGTSSTGTQTSVASSASSVQIIAASDAFARMGVSIYNDSTAVLYLLLSAATASTSAYTVQMAAASYYEVPYNYVGEINGIWASANGNARVTEFKV
jgi:hypothetical protein